MLLVFAHPNDESFAAGATIAKYVKAGWGVDLVCVTRPDEAGQKELEEAGTLLGISSITFFEYRQSTLVNELPGELEDQIYRKMEELVPDCVITFDTSGTNNDPDHIRVCYSTTFAFQKYAVWIEERLQLAKEYNEELAPKLYYSCVPETVVTYLKKKKVLSLESFGKPQQGTPDKFITTVITAAGFERLKKKALLVYKEYPDQALRKQEYFILRMHGTREVFMGKNDRVSAKL